MRDYNFYIEAAKTKQGFKYDNQIDSALGFKGSMINHVRKRNKQLSEESMIKLAELAGLDPLTAIADLNVLRSKGTAAHPLYQRIAEQVLHICLVAGVLVGLVSPSHANIREQTNITEIHNIHYHFIGLLRNLWKNCITFFSKANLTYYGKEYIRLA